jgi:hypothetical protein
MKTPSWTGQVEEFTNSCDAPFWDSKESWGRIEERWGSKGRRGEYAR